MNRHRNASKKVPNGRTVQTRDEYFNKANNYIKPGYENKKGGNYRKAVVVDSNRKNELALVKLTTSSKGYELPNYKKGESKFKPFVETKDNNGNFIKLGNKFIANKKKDDLSKKDVNKIKKELVKKKITLISFES